MTTLQQQLDCMHSSFDRIEKAIERGHEESRPIRMIEKDIETLEMCLAIIVTITGVMEEQSQAAQFAAVCARKELRHAKAGVTP